MISLLFLLLLSLPLTGPLQPLLIQASLVVMFLGVSVFKAPTIPPSESAPQSHSQQGVAAPGSHVMLSANPSDSSEGDFSMADALDTDRIQSELKALPDWRYENNALHKEFKFGSFREAISFIVRLSFSAEELNHHPELSNVYNSVKITLTTHDAGNQVTELDLKLAQAIEEFNWTS